jgi:hypothetical protein
MAISGQILAVKHPLFAMKGICCYFGYLCTCRTMDLEPGVNGEAENRWIAVWSSVEVEMGGGTTLGKSL